MDTKKRNARQYGWTKENYDRIPVLVPKGMKDEIKEEAKKRGVSVSELFRVALANEMKGGH